MHKRKSRQHPIDPTPGDDPSLGDYEISENESMSRFVAYWSTYLFWASVFLLSVIIAFMD